MFMLSLLFLSLAVFGHLLITRASLGFCYTLGVRRQGWNALILAHAIVGIAGAVLLVWLGRASAPPPAWRAYAAGCALVVPIGAAVVAWRRVHAIPSLQLSNHTTTHDAVAALRRVPAPLTLAGRVARLPGNECFRLDERRREVVLPRLPAALDGLSILHLTDLHFTGTPDRGYYEWALDLCAAQRPDLVALTGDIVDDVALLDWLPTTLGRLRAPLGQFFILGNHDIDTAAVPIREAMERIGWQWLGGRSATVTHNGCEISVAGSEHPWAGERPACDGNVMRRAALRVLLSHAPHEVRWARRNAFDLVLAGHLHGGQIRLPLMGPIIGGRLASGLFDLPPTVLHVGRGLGELAPLRFGGCRPEIVNLVLRSVN